jgi:GAF domain-containing protein
MENKNELFNILIEKINKLLKSKEKLEIKLKKTCRILKESVIYYNWVGFYLADNSKKILELSQFVGEPTIHTKIKFGVGICGQTAELKKIFVVQDVTKESNYLSCSSSVKSEIVVPIMFGEEFLGELDIDSHILNPFTKEDKNFLLSVCEKLAPLLKSEKDN